jgi:very-short-patch-repair endonuclease
MIFGPVVAQGITEGAARWVESPPNLINVAATRAKEAFYFVADFESCRSQQGILSDLTKYVETVEELRSTSEAELKLFTELVTFGLDPEVHVSIGDLEVDFVLEEQARRLVIEVDGSQHKAAKAQDAGRDAYLIGLGYEVLRVTARQVLETPALVVKAVFERLGQELDD